MSVNSRSIGESWWWCHEIFDLSKGKSRPKEGLDLLYEKLWKPNELSAWAYELARRLPKVDRTIAPDIALKLANLPSYPNLESQQKMQLKDAFTKCLVRPVAIKGNLLKRSDYSQPVGSWRFDLQATDNALSGYFIKWINSQRKLAQQMPRTKPNDSEVSMEHDLDRLVNWQMVDLLDHKKNSGLPLPSAQRKMKVVGKRLARKFLPLVLKALNMSEAAAQGSYNFLATANMPAASFVPGNTWSFTELESLLVQAKRSRFKRLKS